MMSSKAKYIKLGNIGGVTKDSQQLILADHNKLNPATTVVYGNPLSGYRAQYNFARRTVAVKPQKRSASHMKTLDTNLDIDHSFDFVRTLSAENIKLQEANVRLKEAECKRVHEHACLQKKVKRMERERLQLLTGLEESGFTESQIDYIKRKGVFEQKDDSSVATIKTITVMILCKSMG